MRTRFALLALAVLAALGAWLGRPSTSGAQRAVLPIVSPSQLTLGARPFRDAILTRPARTLRSLSFTGGTYRTPDGIPVQLFVSDSYAPRDAANQSLVNFLGWLAHGNELGRVRIYVITPGEVEQTCGGPRVVACYSPADERLFVPGDESAGLPLVQVMAHEYGHHVARNRSNTPWLGGFWGPKRWASYMRVCPAVRNQDMFPGDQGIGYKRNPGEGWAEAYRRYNELRARQSADPLTNAAWPAIGWNIVNALFIPNGTALKKIEQDVLHPWSGPTRSEVAGRIGRTGRKAVTVRTPLDGSLRITVTGGNARGRIRTTGGSALSGTGTDLSATVCGQRTVKVSLKARPNTRFRLTVLAP